MNNPTVLSALIGIAMATVLALRGLRSYRLGSQKWLVDPPII